MQHQTTDTAAALAEYVGGSEGELFDRLRLLREWRGQLADDHGLASLLDRAQRLLIEELERRALEAEEITPDMRPAPIAFSDARARAGADPTPLEPHEREFLDDLWRELDRSTAGRNAAPRPGRVGGNARAIDARSTHEAPAPLTTGTRQYSGWETRFQRAMGAAK